MPASHKIKADVTGSLTSLILAFIILFALCSDASGLERRLDIDSLWIEDGVLLVNVHVDGLLSDKMIEGLERGLTSLVEYRIQLWHHKFLMSTLAAEAYHSIKVKFDHWERKFAIFSEDENRLTSSVETLREKCSTITGLALADTAKLDLNADYYVTVNLNFEPISTENYEQLKTLLQGEIGTLDPSKKKEPPKQNGGSRGRLFNIFVSLLGFGDKILTAKSEQFKVKSDSLIIAQ